jgi:hypothetical protein
VGNRAPNSAKQDQSTPNKSKQNCLDLFGFIRPNRDFSTGYGGKNKKISPLLFAGIATAGGCKRAIWQG